MTIKNTENGTTMRARLSKSIVLAIRRLMQQERPDAESLDMAAFVVLALELMATSVDSAAQAWEKRDYWLKADHFRQDWAWLNQSQQALKTAVLSQDWQAIARELIVVGQHLQDVQLSPNHRLGTPWNGAWEQLQKSL
jgi:hypothetical protein